MDNSSSTKTELHVRKHNIQDFYRLYPDEEFEILTLDQVREILGKALQGKCLSDYIREDRDS